MQGSNLHFWKRWCTYNAVNLLTKEATGFEPTNNITSTQGLYNGNIRFTTNQIKGFSAISYVYSYDQLNRLSGMRSKTITNHDWSLNVATDHNYEETVTYDANGNIRTYWRNQETGSRMDQLTYHYDAVKKNRLLSVVDASTATAFAEDVKGTETFSYDAIGNLVAHTKPSGMQTLEWNAYGKVKTVTKGTMTMTFGYDAQQNRLKKTVNGVTSYYIRDAQGNTLAVYERNGSSLKWKEQDLYGSSRLGMAKPEREVTGFFWASAAYTLVAGAKSYELSNHLGNVMAVISDRGELQSAQDFYPFGMAMPGRSTGSYKYTFNGKETDPETGIQDYGMRWYLPNIARFPSVDPIADDFPWNSPYAFAENDVIRSVDLDGLEKYIVTRRALPGSTTPMNLMQYRPNAAPVGGMDIRYRGVPGIPDGDYATFPTQDVGASQIANRLVTNQDVPIETNASGQVTTSETTYGIFYQYAPPPPPSPVIKPTASTETTPKPTPPSPTKPKKEGDKPAIPQSKDLDIKTHGHVVLDNEGSSKCHFIRGNDTELMVSAKETQKMINELKSQVATAQKAGWSKIKLNLTYQTGNVGAASVLPKHVKGLTNDTGAFASYLTKALGIPVKLKVTQGTKSTAGEFSGQLQGEKKEKK